MKMVIPHKISISNENLVKIMAGKKSIIPSRPNEGNIAVSCRFRPLNEREKEKSMEIVADFAPDGKTVSINQQYEGFGSVKFTFDNVFPPDSEQVTVYEATALPIIEAVMNGFNGTVFAYGQTSSGKTFTMSGPDIYDDQMKGIIPRMVSTVFDGISQDGESEFLVKVGFCEIYLEKIKDLIDPSRKDLKVQEDKARGVYIAGLSEYYVNSGDELLQYMNLGQQNREVGFTLMNAGSSRSHSIFITEINQKSLKDFSQKTGKLYLVDLAGSEKVSKTGATGKVLDEAKNINLSLTCLGKVIHSLTDGKSNHIPYRDSKLTRVLQDSLGGNSKTSLIITCSPSPFNESETISTLRFGERAKSIKNKPKVNKEFTVAELKLMLARAEEQLMKKDKYILELEDLLKKNSINLPVSGSFEAKQEEEESALLKDLKETREAFALESEKNEMLQNEISQLRIQLDSLQDLHKTQQSKLEEIEDLLNSTQEKLENAVEAKNVSVEDAKTYFLEKTELEKQVSELVNNIETVKLETVNQKIVEVDTIASFEVEFNKYEKLWEKIQIAEDVLKGKEGEKSPLLEILAENITREKKAIDENIFKKFLDGYFKEVERLTFQLSQVNSKYQDLLLRLSSNQKKDEEMIEKYRFETENLRNIYYKIANEKSNMKIENQFVKKKLEELQNINKEQNNKIEALEQKLYKITQEQVTLHREIIEHGGFDESLQSIPTNVRKPIKGGSKFLLSMRAQNMSQIGFIKEALKDVNG
jgi:kinesin family protein 5